MGVVVVDAVRVARLEVRRYLRWRPLRRWQLGFVLLSVCWSLTALIVLQYSSSFINATLSAPVRQFILAAWYPLPTAVGFIVVLCLTPRIIGDTARRGTLSDLYLTDLHPLGIVLGKLLSVALLAGMLMLAVSPPCALAAAYAGASLTQWASSLLIGWFALWLPMAMVARLQWRAIPELEGLRRRRFAPTPLSATILTLIALLLYAYLHSAARAPTGTAFLMTISTLLPFGAALYAGAMLPLGALIVPVSPIIVAISLSGALTAAIATAQWLGWWSAFGYWLQRGLGGLWLLGLTGLFGMFWSVAGVPGEGVYYYGVLWAGAASYLLARFMFGVYGVGKRSTRHEGWLSVMREWALLWLLAGVCYGAIGLTRGIWLSPLWAVALAFYYWSLLAWVQSFSIETIKARYAALRNGTPPTPRYHAQFEMCPIDYPETASILQLIVQLYLLLQGLRNDFVVQILHYPILLTPLGGLLRTDFVPSLYVLYGMYALGMLTLRARWKLRR
ncbi:MAG: hypothetical protein NZ556_05495 [Fimbriimonadales bacterium]|nr:hypothetical protein [Fimbriimonadales bacterium]